MNKIKFPRLPVELNKSKKLTPADVKGIRSLIKKGMLKKDIAKAFKVSTDTIWRSLLPKKEKEEVYKRQYRESKQRESKSDKIENKRKRQLKSAKRRYKLVPDTRLYMNQVKRNSNKNKNK